MSLRQNVRNFLIPLTISEVKRELELSLEMGQTRRADYIAEFLRELEEDFNNCDTDEDEADFPNYVW